MSVSKSIDYSGSRVFLRNLQRQYPVITHGKGVYLYDTSGKRYIDAVAGAYVVSVGHGNAAVVDVISKQLREVGYVNGTQFTTQATEELADILARLGKNLGLSRSVFLCSGSEAIEAAIKMARQLAHIQNGEQRGKIICRTPSYHGNTLFALGASGRPSYKKPFRSLLSEVLTIPAPQSVTCEVDYLTEGADFYVRPLEALLEREGQAVFALLVEPVSGSSLGGQTPPPGYFEKVQKLCRQHGVLIIADEVLVGSGRTGTFFASEQVGLKPDIMVLGKGLNGGYAPLSAVMTSEQHFESIRKASQNFLHSQTFQQAPCMTAAGLGVLKFFESENLVSHVSQKGEWLRSELAKAFRQVESKVHLTGVGLLAGLDVRKGDGSAFDRKEKIAETLVANALDYGITLWPNAGHLNETEGDIVLIAPPLTTTKSEISEIAAAVGHVLRDTLSKF